MNRNTKNGKNNAWCYALLAITTVIMIASGVAVYFIGCFGGSLIREQYFSERFASLPEVKQLFNLSSLTLSSEIFTSYDPFYMPAYAGTSSEPASLTQVVTELLLHTVRKQRALEDRILKLEEQVEIQDGMLSCAVLALVVYGVLRYWRCGDAGLKEKNT